jgi:hypothetical protein
MTNATAIQKGEAILKTAGFDKKYYTFSKEHMSLVLTEDGETHMRPDLSKAIKALGISIV